MYISATFVRGILSELQDRGIGAARVRDELGLTDELLDCARARLSLADMSRIVRGALLLSADPGLGLALGCRAPKSMLQLLGPMLLACRTLREAFSLLEPFVPLVADGVTFSLREDGPHALFGYRCAEFAGSGARFASEYVLAMTLRIAGTLVPSRLATPVRALFVHAEPEYVQRYLRVFDCPVWFEQDIDALVFPRELLDLPQHHADPVLRDALRELGQRTLRERDTPTTWTERVREVLRREDDLSALDLQTLSRRLTVAPRMLRRRLSSEGTSVTALVDEARCRIACHELRRHTPIKRIAERAGFGEQTAFHRAFKRWTGQTPRQYLRES